MPVQISSVTVIGRRTVGKRGRTRTWNASDYVIDPGGFLDVTADIAKAVGITPDALCAFIGGTVALDTTQAEKFDKVSKSLRNRVKVACDLESLATITPLTLVGYADESGDHEAVGFIRDENDDESDEVEDDENDDENDDEDSDDEDDA